MKKLAIGVVAVLTLFVASLAACSSGDGDGGNTGPQETVVRGIVTNLSGVPLSGVAVEGGGAQATTNARGAFELDAAAAAGTIVRFEKDGFLSTVRKIDVLDGHPTAVTVTMAPMADAIALDADAGGTATGMAGAALTAAAGAFVDGSGGVVTGEVDVFLTPLDPSRADELAAFPGDLIAENASGTNVALESMGVLEVQVQQNGEKLQVADGQTVTIRIPAPEGVATPDAEIDIWSFDESTGIWKFEGTGTYLQAEHVYEAEISHFSYWNADKVAEATSVTGQVVDSSGNPAPGASVVATGIDYLGSTSTTADATGRFCVAVRKSSQIRITVANGSGGYAQQEFTSGDDDTTVPPQCGAGGLDIGTITIGDAQSCEDVGNPFEDTCASGAGSVFACFGASGACTTSFDQNTYSVTTVYENGARMEMEVQGDIENPTGMLGTIYGPDGNECGTMMMPVAPDSDTYSYTITNTDGDAWTITQKENGDLEVACPGGQYHTMTRAQVDALMACTQGGGTSQSGSTCTIEGLPGNGGTPNGGLCDGDDDCEGGQVCCDVFGTNICADQATCEQMSANMCTSDGDCMSPLVCCDIAGAGGFCTYAEACQQ